MLISLVVHDTYFYWMHRALHHKSIFRFTHLVHHQSANPSPWAAYSFHLLEAIAEGGIVIVLAFVLPMHPLAIKSFTIASFVINVYGHLGYEIMPKSFRRSFWFGIFNTSVYHNLHHSKFKGNYGLYLRFWDRLMRTGHPDYVKEYDRVQEQRFGNKAGGAAPAGINKKGIAAMLLLCCCGTRAFTQVEGNWKDRESGDSLKVTGTVLFISESHIWTREE